MRGPGPTDFVKPLCTLSSGFGQVQQARTDRAAKLTPPGGRTEPKSRGRATLPVELWPVGLWQLGQSRRGPAGARM
jgi:hypothetical protein